MSSIIIIIIIVGACFFLNHNKARSQKIMKTMTRNPFDGYTLLCASTQNLYVNQIEHKLLAS